MTFSPGLGWQPDLPDSRDRKPEDEAVWDQLAQVSRRRKRTSESLREHFREEIADQRELPASPAFACGSLAEYFRNRVDSDSTGLSKLFLYHTASRLSGDHYATSLELRTTLKAMTRFGLPHEKFWPDTEPNRNAVPSDPFLYGFAKDYASIQFVRLDSPDGNGIDTLDRVKGFLAAGFPSVFGFTVPATVTRDGRIPWRRRFEVMGGQAVVAVGYDDHRYGKKKGALEFLNTWGADWGENGYGWLPYRFVEKRLALDFWTLLQPRWLDSDEFRRPDISCLAGNGRTR
ncbi:MAG: C1 family peptidase [Planctomycetota bacterium]